MGNSLRNIHVLADEAALARAVASAVADVIRRAVAGRGRCALALSGGATPRALYRQLAGDFRDGIPWEEVDVFWGDERFVPHTDDQSNYGMAKAALLDHVRCPAANVHPVPTNLATPSDAAAAYAATLDAYFDASPPRFDLLLLGIGEDCHTASLFPRSPALDATGHSVIATAERVTLTLPVLIAASTVFVLATGPRKAAAVARALSPESDPHDCPAAALRSSTGTVHWWLDRAAAAQVAP